jgi:hypothetical protein
MCALEVKYEIVRRIENCVPLNDPKNKYVLGVKAILNVLVPQRATISHLITYTA